jgi:hypothetical protein
VADLKRSAEESIVIKDSPGIYYFGSALFGVVAVGMLFGAYWSFETDKIQHVLFSLLMASFGVWMARTCFRRARALGKEEPIQPPETTRGK